MKKLLFFVSTFAFLLLLNSCEEEEPKPEDVKIDLTGEWLGEGYTCPPNYNIAERISIAHNLESGEVVATKITGDACVTAGNVTFNGVYDGESSSFAVTFTTGTPTSPNSSSTSSSINVINSKLMKDVSFEGVVFTRDFKVDLPPCPCSYDDSKIQNEKREKEGVWCKSGKISTTFGDFHHGATYEARWIPDKSGEPGQQCTYLDDASKSLITKGIAAGSPDIVSPGGCSFVTADWSLNHKTHDVTPWQTIPCWKYLDKWASNNENGCSPKTVSGIDHMKVLAGDMTCEDITLLISTINDPFFNSSLELINYINGTSTKRPVNLKQQLEGVRGKCGTYIDICNVLTQAINNL